MSIEKQEPETFKGFTLENSLTRLSYFAINLDSNSSTLNAYKYAETAAREAEKVTPEEGVPVPDNKLGGKGFQITGFKLTDERRLAIMDILYAQAAETEGYTDGIKK